MRYVLKQLNSLLDFWLVMWILKIEALPHKNIQQKLLITLSRRYKGTEKELILSLFK